MHTRHCVTGEKRRQLNRDIPSEDENMLSQSHNEISKIDNKEAINKEIDTVRCPTSSMMMKSSSRKRGPWGCQ